MHQPLVTLHQELTMREAQAARTTQEPARHSLTGLILSKALEHLAGSRKHRDEDDVPIPYRPRRHPPDYVPPVSRSSSYQPPLPPCPRLSRRERCLTPTSFESASSNSSSSSPWVNEQTQSLLLNLPRELRLLIYEQAIGDRLVHIIRRRDGHQCIVCHTACKSDGEPDACKEAQCRGYKLPTGLFVKSPVSGHGYAGIIQLLQTCRKVYIEAVQALYASNIFSFDCMETLVEFSTCILPQRLDSIQSLQLDFRFTQSLQFSESTASNDWPRWERAWRIIDSMKSLQNLQARISWPKQTSRFDAAQEKRLLEPLFMVRGLRRYEVNLQRLKGGEEWSVEGCPFRVVRRI